METRAFHAKAGQVRDFAWQGQPRRVGLDRRNARAWKGGMIRSKRGVRIQLKASDLVDLPDGKLAISRSLVEHLLKQPLDKIERPAAPMTLVHVVTQINSPSAQRSPLSSGEVAEEEVLPHRVGCT